VDRHATTVVCVVGDGARAAVEALRGRANVRVVVPEGEAVAADRAGEAWRLAAGTSVPYLVHDADPLAAVADAWVRRFDEAGAIGELEVAVADLVARWRARTVGLPDYYLVRDAESLSPTRRHWYLGYLHGAAPARVVPARGPASALADGLGRLPTGRWWPDVDRLLEGVELVVPDRAGSATLAAWPT
jgi:hypothetical protein